jgi:hypothetical protein
MHEDGSRSLQRFVDEYGRGPYLRKVSQRGAHIIYDHGAST